MTEECQELFLYFEAMVQGINVYDLNGICWNASVSESGKPELYASNFLDVKETIQKKRTTQADYTSWIRPL